jgi:hypothetical protein
MVSKWGGEKAKISTFLNTSIYLFKNERHFTAAAFTPEWNEWKEIYCHVKMKLKHNVESQSHSFNVYHIKSFMKSALTTWTKNEMKVSFSYCHNSFHLFFYLRVCLCECEPGSNHPFHVFIWNVVWCISTNRILLFYCIT